MRAMDDPEFRDPKMAEAQANVHEWWVSGRLPLKAEDYDVRAGAIMDQFIGRPMNERLVDDIQMEFELLKCTDIVVEMDKAANRVTCTYTTPLGDRMVADTRPGATVAIPAPE